ncbi:hypothetical protein [Streptomyces sp. NPDC021622]|uniref:hypothetical protein n=1 Tax=Streptomyces sp. NPDC021622 TaxID=3155013 RepID=UPI0033D4D0D6
MPLKPPHRQPDHHFAPADGQFGEAPLIPAVHPPGDLRTVGTRQLPDRAVGVDHDQPVRVRELVENQHYRLRQQSLLQHG